MKKTVLIMAAFCVALAATQSAKAQDAVVVEEETIAVGEAVNCKTNYWVKPNFRCIC